MAHLSFRVLPCRLFGAAFVFGGKAKKVNFEGVVVLGAESLRGFCLWDASSSYVDPKTGKPKTYKYKEPYPVSLVQ